VPSLVPPVLLPSGVFAGEQPSLAGDSVLLRPWRDDDASALLAAYADPGIQHWNGMRLDPAEAAAYAAEWAELWQTGRRVGWAIERRGADADADATAATLVGRITLSRLDLEQGQGEVTYWVGPAARGTGVAPAAVEAVAAWAFGLGFHRLELEHSVGNISSCRVADKTGFRLEGTLRSAVRHDDGWHDMHLHARLAGDAVSG